MSIAFIIVAIILFLLEASPWVPGSPFKLGWLGLAFFAAAGLVH
jgi:hypothetical protein